MELLSFGVSSFSTWHAFIGTRSLLSQPKDALSYITIETMLTAAAKMQHEANVEKDYGKWGANTKLIK
jgi:hypothetical protein